MNSHAGYFQREKDSGKGGPIKEKKFLREVQNELEDRRSDWTGEVEKMIEGLSVQKLMERDTLDAPGHISPKAGAANGYVEHTDTGPIYHAFVDVKEYPASGISVTVDNLENKLVVKAQKDTGPDNVTRTFTQKVALPKFADDQGIRTKLMSDGILRIEVPLMFYFEPVQKKPKSFINQVKQANDGSKSVEIMVNIGAGIRPWEIKVRVNEKDELLIQTEKENMLSDGTVTKKRTLIKRYILPRHADVTGIISQLGNDGRLGITVPLRSDHFDSDSDH